ELVEGAHGRAAAQHGPAARVDELQRLDEELDLADAADAVLDVEARVDAAGVELDLDLLVERRDLVDDGGRGRARVDEGLQRGHQLLAQLHVAGARPRLEPRLALPRPAEALVVALDGRQRVGDGAAAALGAQPQVDAEDHVLVRDLAERRRHPLAQLGEELVQRQVADLAAVRAVDVDEIDVGGEVELLAAELAQADDHQL